MKEMMLISAQFWRKLYIAIVVPEFMKSFQLIK